MAPERISASLGQSRRGESWAQTGGVCLPGEDGSTTETREAAAPAPGRELLAGSAILSLGILASKLLGALRQVLVQSVFGPGFAQDAYLVAENVPRRASAVLTDLQRSCTVSVIGRHLAAGDHRRAWAVQWWAMLFAGALVVIAVGAVQALSNPVAAVLAQGYDAGERRTVAHLLRILMLLLLVEGVAGVATAGWLARRSFLIAGVALVIPNAVVVGALLALGRSQGITGYAWSNVAGSVLYAAAMTVPFAVLVARCGAMRCAPPWADLRIVVGLAAPLVLPAVVGPLAVAVEGSYATALPSGTISWLRAAQVVIEAPLGTLVAAVGTVLLPILAHQAAGRDGTEYRSRVHQVMRLVVLLVTPATLLVVLYAEPLVRVLFERGEFGPTDTAATVPLVRVLAWGSLLAAVGDVFGQAFLALQDARTPSFVEAAAQAGRIAQNAALFRYGGLTALLAGRIAARGAVLIALLALLRKRLGAGPARESLSFAVRLVAANAAMAAVATLLMRLSPLGDGAAADAAGLLVGVLVCCAVYAVAVRALHPADWSAVSQRFRRNTSGAR